MHDENSKSICWTHWIFENGQNQKIMLEHNFRPENEFERLSQLANGSFSSLRTVNIPPNCWFPQKTWQISFKILMFSLIWKEIIWKESEGKFHNNKTSQKQLTYYNIIINNWTIAVKLIVSHELIHYFQIRISQVPLCAFHEAFRCKRCQLN